MSYQRKHYDLPLVVFEQRGNLPPKIRTVFASRDAVANFTVRSYRWFLYPDLIRTQIFYLSPFLSGHGTRPPDHAATKNHI